MVVNLFSRPLSVLSLKEISSVKRGPRLPTSRTVPISILHRLSDTVFWCNFGASVPVGIATIVAFFRFVAARKLGREQESRLFLLSNLCAARVRNKLGMETQANQKMKCIYV